MLRRKLTVVVPCKNEQDYIGHLLDDLALQKGIKGTRVVIADANSTDDTVLVIEEKRKVYEGILDILITEGGKVSKARNSGARLAKTPFIVFIDADTRLFQQDTLQSTLDELEYRGKSLLTCRLKCYRGSFLDKVLYLFYNLLHAVLVRFYPFAIGTYFMIRKSDFIHYGQFDEHTDTCEDFLFSQNFSLAQFHFHHHYVGQDNRRLAKMGRLGMAKYLLVNLFNFIKKNKKYFNTSNGYWG